jgi:hypothetical protein
MIFSISAVCAVCVYSTIAQEFANDTLDAVDEAIGEEFEEQDPKATSENEVQDAEHAKDAADLQAVRAKIMADMAEAARRVKQKADFLEEGLDNLWDFMPNPIPEEFFHVAIRDQIVTNTDVLFLMMDPSYTVGEPGSAYWAPCTNWAFTNLDVKVAIDTNATAGYLGNDKTNGVLRTDATIDYADGGNFITLSANITNIVNESNIWYNIRTNNFYGTTNHDEKVAVSGGAAPGYLGTTRLIGVLRTDPSITYANGGGFITLSVDADYVVSNATPGVIGGNTYHKDLLWEASTAVAGQNDDHDARYWAHGKAWNDTDGGLWGWSIGYGTSDSTPSKLRIDLQDAELIAYNTTPLPKATVDWYDCFLRSRNGGNRITVAWEGGLLRDPDDQDIAMDWGAQTMKDDDEITSVKWDSRILSDTSVSNSVDWENRQLIDTNGSVALDWSGSLLGGTNFLDDIYWRTYDDGSHIDSKNYRTTGDVHVDMLGWVSQLGPGGVFVNSKWDEDVFQADCKDYAYIYAATNLWLGSHFGNIGLYAPGNLTIGAGANIGATITNGAVKLVEQGIVVNDGSWTIQEIEYIAPGGTTNTMTVLAKP